MKHDITAFDSIEMIVASAARIVRPPEHLTVTEAAIKYRRIKNHFHDGDYDPDVAPYGVEVQDSAGSRLYSSVAFVGPAQAGKSELMFNLINHTAICTPMPMMIVEKDQVAARDTSIRRVANLLSDTPRMNELALKGRHNRSIYTTMFKTGMILNMGWPTKNQLSGKPIGKLWLPDYDRFPDDIDGEGAAFDLARKRTTTFGREGMTVAESSPSKVNTNPKWRRKTPHEAPPVGGIVGLYNRGDRRRWYYQCIDCKGWFEPGFFETIRFNPTLPPAMAAKAAHMCCPHCGDIETGQGIYFHDGEVRDDGEVRPGKKDLNKSAKWVPDGQHLDAGGNLCGEKSNPSEIASFWLKGPAAAFISWETLVERYLTAEDEFNASGDENNMKSVINTDLGEVYTPKGLGSSRLPEDMKTRAEDLGERVVPDGVRFLVANIDTQKTHWVVQVHGIGEDSRIWVIDRFRIKKSNRVDEDGHPVGVKPHVYLEDWDLITEQVVNASYELADDSGRRMAIKLTTVDGYGVDGVTSRAYDWWRGLKKSGGDLHRRVYITKGDPNNAAPLWKISYPDSARKDRKAQARGDVPVLMICSKKAKDGFSNILERKEDGPGFVRWPNWLEDWWYSELTVEEKDVRGNWVAPKGTRNEAWDLLVYCYVAIQSRDIKAQMIEWSSPPAWAAEWDVNALVFDDKINKPFENHLKDDRDDLERLGELLA